MQQRKVVSSSRPSGTDGSDFSYRMVVDSRYTKVAKWKSQLSRLFILQAILLMANILLISLSLLKEDSPNILALSSAAASFFALVTGESGRRCSRTSFMKIYLALSSVAMVTSVVYIFTSNHVMKLLQSQGTAKWERPKELLLQYMLIFAGSLVQVFTGTITIALISNMSPPKKS